MKLPQPRVIYQSPTGKRCMLVPTPGPDFYFRYLDQAEINGDGFTISHASFRLLRELPALNVTRPPDRR